MFKKFRKTKKNKGAVSEEPEIPTTTDKKSASLRTDTAITTYSAMNMDDKYKVYDEDRDAKVEKEVEKETKQERQSGSRSVSFLARLSKSIDDKFIKTKSSDEKSIEPFESISGSDSSSSSTDDLSNPVSITESASVQNTAVSVETQKTTTTSNKSTGEKQSEIMGLSIISSESEESAKTTKTSSTAKSAKSITSTKSTKSQVETQKNVLDTEVAKSTPKNEVNYDVNPTLLYKFIETKDWDETAKRIDDAPEECKIWVYRIEEFNSFDLSEYSKKGSKELNIRWRMLPIHSAIIFNAPIKVIMALFKAYPESLMECDDRKMLPIHLACRLVSNVNVAQFLVYKREESLFAQDYKGRRAIDILREYRDKNKCGKEKDTIDKKEVRNRESLIQLMDEKMYAKEKEHHDKKEDDGTIQAKKSSSVFKILKKKKSTENALLSYSNENEVKSSTTPALERKSEQSDAKETEERMPVKKNMKIQRTEETAKEPRKEENYDTYPTLLIKLIEKKMWDQAIARCNDKPQEASTWMTRLQEIDDEKSKKNETNEVRWRILPIHSAIVLHAPVEVIEALVEAYPKGLQKGDDRKMLPLHMAFRLGASPETAAVLVDAYPDALKKKDVRGHTPLHILKAYRRKYVKDLKAGKKSTTMTDINRKKLIKFYVGGRKYGHSTGKDGVREFDSDSDSSSSHSSNEDSCYYSDEEAGNFIHEFAQQAIRELQTLQYIVRDTVTCRGSPYDLGA